MGCTASWGAVGLPRGAQWGKGRQGAVEMDSSELIFRLFMIEVILDQTLRNWYNFIKPIQKFTNSEVITKCDVLFYCYYLR
jgi:hypothetical protein